MRKMVACANEMVMLVSGIFFSSMSEIMAGTLREVCVRALKCGLGINPSKAESMLLNTKVRISAF